jgi:integration host factor subunit beta
MGMATITKKKLVQVISQELGLHPNDVKNVIQAFLDRMTEYLGHGDRLEFRDFGVFETVVREQKVGRNPKRADVPIIIPRRKAVKFTAGRKMKKMIEIQAKSKSGAPSSSM